MRSLWLIQLFLILSLVRIFAQQVPDFTIEFSPASVFGSTRPTPQDTFARGYSLQPKLGLYAHIKHGFSAGLHFDYDYTGGEIFDDYTRLSIAPAIRYNLNAKKSTWQSFDHYPKIINRLLVSTEVGYQIKAFESEAALNRGRFSGEGLYGSVSVGMAFAKYFGLGYKFNVAEKGTLGINDGIRVGHSIYAILPLLHARNKLALPDPKSKELTSAYEKRRERERKARLEARDRLPKAHRAFLETNFGWAPSPEFVEVVGDTSFRNDLYTYGLGVGLNGLLNRQLEVVIQIDRITSKGSFIDQNDRSSQNYLTYGLEARYRVNLPFDHWDILGGIRVLGTNYCPCGEDDGFSRPGNVLIGATGTVRFIPAEWIWIDASMGFHHLFNPVDLKYGYNYPSLRIGVPVGKKNR